MYSLNGAKVHSKLGMPYRQGHIGKEVLSLEKAVRSLESTILMYLVTLQKLRMGYACISVGIKQIK